MRSVVTSILLLVACSVGRAYDHPAPTAGDPYEVVIRDHAMFLNELSNRRRVNTFFPNQQSSFYGIQFRYVNSSRGSLTFVRRDLVTVGRIPIVVGRVYDSMSRKDEGFGPGWRLSLAETVSVLADGTLRYIDDSGSETILVRRRGSYAPAVPGPSDFLSLEMRDDQLRLETRGGWTRVFSRRDDQYVLTAIRDAYGNTMRLRHGALGLAHIAAPNGRFVAIERGASGRIQRVYDDQERVLSYTYNERGLLRTVTDFGGNEWRYDYDEFGRLKLAVDPQNVSILEAQSDARHRATSVRVLGSKFDYRYEVGRTTIRDEAGRSTIVAHNRFGTTTSVTSASGFLSQVQLDTRNRVTSLSHNSRPMATLSYREDGQLATLTRFDESGPTRFSYTYDASNRPTEIASSDGLVIALAYNPAGDLVRKQNGVYWH